MKTSEMAVQWERVARPQTDGYDTDIALNLAALRGLHLPSVNLNEPLLGNSNLALRQCTHWNPSRFGTVSLDDSNITRAIELISTWPNGWAQARRLLTAVYVALDKTASPHVWGGVSGPGPLGFGTIAGTINSPLGFAQAVVHEMAHHKLRALGIEFESADALILNDPTQLYQSPIRYDRLRPMSAVFHAQYSFTYVSALNVHVIANHRDPETAHGAMNYFLRFHIPKLEFGLDVISRYIETDSDGERLIKGYLDWVTEVISSGHLLIRRLGGVPEPFVHPLK